MLTTVTHNKKTGVSSGGNPEDLEASALIRPAGRDLGDKERVSFKPIGDRWKVLGFFLIWAVVLFFVMGRRPSDAERRVSPAIQDAEEILDNRESPVDVVESDSEGEEEGAEDREGDNREAPNRVKGTVIKYDHSTIAKISDTEAKDALRRLGALFIDTPARSELDLKRCQITTVGEGWGRHTLCGDLIKKDPSGQCLVISFGINKDYSFDVDAQKRTGCEVVSMDPTVSHPAQLAPHVRFFKWAAPGLSKNPRWTVVPLTSVATKVNMQQARIPILKMDCEGEQQAAHDECRSVKNMN